jgi:sortase A
MANRELDRSLRSAESELRHLAPSPLATGDLVGRIEVPRLRMSAIVFEGTDPATLDRGVGHLRGSALPGTNGNVVLAAHRDTFFRPLRDIRERDQINVSAPDGVRHYIVESTRVVNPTEMSVVRAAPDPELTLITCYPFGFFGHAPKRFIVRALAVQE